MTARRPGRPPGAGPARQDRRQKILDWLNANGNATPAAVANGIGQSRSTVWDDIRDLVLLHAVKKLGHGLYAALVKVLETNVLPVCTTCKESPPVDEGGLCVDCRADGRQRAEEARARRKA
jgi:hypothetical protein